MYTQQAVSRTLQDLSRKKISSQAAFRRLKNLPYESLSFAKIDHHRLLRKGFPEAIYAPGKTFKQLEKIISSILSSGQSLLVTRLEEERWERLREKFPPLKYSENGKIAYSLYPTRLRGKPIAIITAGTGDIPAAEEAAITLELMGRRTERFYDCGVAGLHRLVDQLQALEKCSAVICLAGMDGVLPSVVGGLVNKPVIAVPTSIGYGANFKGIAPLLTMLNSCAQGVAVVNIDNGFGAACFASMIG